MEVNPGQEGSDEALFLRVGVSPFQLDPTEGNPAAQILREPL